MPAADVDRIGWTNRIEQTKTLLLIVWLILPVDGRPCRGCDAFRIEAGARLSQATLQQRYIRVEVCGETVPMSNIKMIGVIGGAHCSAEVRELARQVGEGIARGGAALICGGRGGVMAAACEGAKARGGLTIGILPGESSAEANAFVDLKIVTGLRDARNVIIAHTADALIAINGSHGTLSEIAFGLKFGKIVIGLHLEFAVPGVISAASPAEAVQLAFQAIG